MKTKLRSGWLFRQRTGLLKQNQDGRLEFQYSPEWLGSPQARAISASQPLTDEA